MVRPTDGYLCQCVGRSLAKLMRATTKLDFASDGKSGMAGTTVGPERDYNGRDKLLGSLLACQMEMDLYHETLF